MWGVWCSEILVCAWLQGNGRCSPLGSLSFVFPFSMIMCLPIYAYHVIRCLTRNFNSKGVRVSWWVNTLLFNLQSLGVCWVIVEVILSFRCSHYIWGDFLHQFFVKFSYLNTFFWPFWSFVLLSNFFRVYVRFPLGFSNVWVIFQVLSDLPNLIDSKVSFSFLWNMLSWAIS